MINRQVVLASRPKGVAQAEHFAIRDAPVAAPAEGQYPGPQRVPVSRAGDAWLDRRSRQLFRGGRNRLGDARTRRRRNRRIPPSRLSAGRDRYGLVRLAGNGHRRCDRRRASRGRNRPAALARTWRPQDQRRLCAGRADRNRRTPAGRNCVGFDRRGRCVDQPSGKSGKFLAAARSASPAAPKRSRNAAISLDMTRRSITRRGESTKRSRLLAPMGFTSISIIPRARSATRSILNSRLERVSSSAAPPQSPAGTHGLWGLGSSAICSSSAPERRGS